MLPHASNAHAPQSGRQATERQGHQLPRRVRRARADHAHGAPHQARMPSRLWRRPTERKPICDERQRARPDDRAGENAKRKLRRHQLAETAVDETPYDAGKTSVADDNQGGLHFAALSVPSHDARLWSERTTQTPTRARAPARSHQPLGGFAELWAGRGKCASVVLCGRRKEDMRRAN